MGRRLSCGSHFVQCGGSFVRRLLRYVGSSFPRVSLRTAELCFPRRPFRHVSSLSAVVVYHQIFVRHRSVLKVLILSLLGQDRFTLRNLLVPCHYDCLVVNWIVLISDGGVGLRIVRLTCVRFLLPARRFRGGSVFRGTPYVGETETGRRASRAGVRRVMFSRDFRRLLALSIVSLRFVRRRELTGN